MIHHEYTDWAERAHHFLFAIFIMGMLAGPLLFFGHAKAATKTWDGGCGVDTSWSCGNNWSDNVVPASGDTVVFDNTSDNNSTVDAGFAGSITVVNINAGYDGTITLARSLSVATTFSQASGSFNASGQSLTLAAFTLSGGTFTASSATTSVSGALTFSGGTFNANGGTMDFNGTTTATLSCNNAVFNLVTFTNTNNLKTVSSNCSLPLGANPTVGVGGGVTLNGTLSGSGTLTKGTGGFNLNSGGVLSGFSGLVSGGSTVTIAGTYDFSAYTTFTIGAGPTLNSPANVTLPTAGATVTALVVNSGATLTASSGTLNVSSTFTLDAGSTFNANGGTVNFNGNGNATLSCGNKTFNLAAFTHTGAVKTVSNDCNLPLGANPSVTSSLTNNGTLSGSGTLTTAATLTLGVGGNLSGFSGLAAATLAINGAYNLGAYTTFTAGSVTLASGASLTMPSGTASFSGNVTIDSGSTFDANGGALNFTGVTNSTRTISCGNKTFNLVAITYTDGTNTFSSNCNVPLGNNPVIASGGAVVLNGTFSGSGTLAKGNGNLTLGSGGALSGFNGLTTTGTFTVNGAYDFSSYSPFTSGGSFTLGSGASFIAPTGTANFNASFTLNAASTFNANNGTVNFGGTSNGTLACANKSFNFVTFTSTNGTKTVGSDCVLPLGNNPTVGGAGGAVSLNGTLTGSGTLAKSTGTLTLGSGGVLSGFSGLTAVTLTVNGAYDFSSYAPFSSTSTFTVNSGGNFTAPSGTASFGAAFTLNSGSTFNANGGTLEFTGSSNSTLTCNNSVFHLVVFTNTGDKSVSSDCVLPLGNNPSASSGGNINLSGTLSGSGTLRFNVGNAGNGLLRMNTGGALSGFSNLILGASLFINGTSQVDFSGLNSILVGANKLDRPSDPAALTGNLTFTSASAGNFIAPASLRLTGNLTNAGSSTFIANGGTVEILASDSSSASGYSTIAGDFTFHNLSLTPSAANTIVFTAGSKQTVTGALTLNGTSGNPLRLISSASGSPWFLQLPGNMTTSYINVSDSHLLGATITACSSTDGGGNSGWNFTCGGSSAAAVSNFQALQSYFANLQRQEQAAASANPAASSDGDDLPSKIYDFARQFPHGKELKKAAGQFLVALLIGVLIGGMLVLLVIFKRRRKKDEEPATYSTTPPPPAAPGAGPTPGTKIMPSPTPPNPSVTQPVPPQPPSPPVNPLNPEQPGAIVRPEVPVGKDAEQK